MELFKYCKREHMEALLSNGCLRVGTLYDWRSNNQYGELVFDPNEGFTEITGNFIFYDCSFLKDMLFVDSVSHSEENGVPVTHFKNEILHTHNHFTFSASSCYSALDHQRWYEQEGYDACYVIHSPRLFFRSISKELQQAEFRLLSDVLYYDESQSNNIFEGVFHPALLKKNRFGSQNEVRALWRSTNVNTPISPVVVERSNAHKYCSVFRTLNFRSA